MASSRSREADVYCDQALAGTLTRTPRGARFTYLPSYLAQHEGRANAAVAFAMPLRSAPYEVVGVNVHPFFAGLLPEGLRFKALVRAVKTSEDDLFSLLLAAGMDAIGNVSVTRPGEALTERAPLADLSRPGALHFHALFEASLKHAKGRGDISIAGVQPKVSAGMISFPVRLLGKRRAYILKLNPADSPRIVENEAFFMGVASAVGIEAARVRVVTDAEGESGLMVERFDRVPDPATGQLKKLHLEDACQLLDRYPADKYNLTLGDIAKAFPICSAPVVETLKLLRQQAFSYLIANGDMHAKNVSIIEREDGRITLSPAYDLLSTLPYGDRVLALAIEGRDDKLKLKHFVAFGERLGVRKQATESMLANLCRRVGPWVARVEEIGLDPRKAANLQKLMGERLKQLSA